MWLTALLVLGAWTEGFETQDYFPPNGWLVVNEDALDAVWYRTLSAGHSGQHAAVCNYDTAFADLSSTNRDYLVTPLVVPQDGDTTVSFWHRSTTAESCTLDVMVCTSVPPSMTAFSALRSFLPADTSWMNETVSLGAYRGIPVYLAFRVRRIPFRQSVSLDDITLPDSAPQPQVYNGRLRTKGPPSQKYLRVWGTSYEMGFAHGYLLANEIMDIYISKWIGNTSYHASTPASYENNHLPMYRAKYYVPAEYREEAQGIIDGIAAKGVSLYHPDLGRNLTAEDIWAITGAGDTVTFGCSSLSGWGESTINDDSLQGGFVIARNVDGTVGLHMSLANSSAIVAYSPSAPDRQQFFNVNFGGVFGVFSCLNERGVGLCGNAGNHPDTNPIPPNSLLGHLLANRRAVERIDPDSNGVSDIHDIDYLKTNSENLRSHDIHLYSRYDVNHPTPGAVLEINNVGETLRLAADNDIPPGINSEWNLAVTNHDRLLHPPVYCARYQRIADSLNADYHLSTRRAMRIASAAAVGYNSSTSGGTYHSIVIRPNIALEHPDWPCVGVSYARRYRAAQTQVKVWYSWSELFDGAPTGVKETPEPRSRTSGYAPATIVRGRLEIPPSALRNPHTGLALLDITGRKVLDIPQSAFGNPQSIDVSRLAPGIYFINHSLSALGGTRAPIRKVVLTR